MNKVLITTDSTADLSPEILETRNIKMVPLYVRFNDESYKDSIDITTLELYKKVETYGFLPKTQAASPGDFEIFFQKNI